MVLGGRQPLLANGQERRPIANWRRWLYISHFCSAWGERMWEFSAGILLLSLSGGRSLQLTAIYAFAMQLTQFLLGAKVGAHVDGGSPRSTPLLALGGQSCGIALAAASAAASLQWLRGDSSMYGGAAAIVFFSCLAKLSSLASKISVENHWAVALARSDSNPQMLTQVSSTMRAIDLSCKIMAPVAAGLIMSASSDQVAGLVVAALNVLAWPVEVFCLERVWSEPLCRQKIEERQSPTAASGASPTAPTSVSAPRLYFSQRIWASAFALSMLHMTVLSFGQLMTAYVLTLGVPIFLVSVYRSLGEVFGFAATQLKPWIDRQQGLSHGHVATIFIWFQLAMLVPSAVAASHWAREELEPLAASLLLVGGVGASRLGLWGFDLSVTLMLQNDVVPPKASGRVIGVQRALEAMFGMLAGFAGVCLPDPSQFQYLAAGSWLAVFSAALLHTIHAGCPRRPGDEAACANGAA